MEFLSRYAPFKYQNDDPNSSVMRLDVPIAILAVIHVVRGSWLLCQENRVLWHYFQYAQFEDPGVHLWGPPLPTIALSSFSMLVVIAAGVGLLCSKKWGWWLAGSIYMYMVVGAIYMVVMSYVRKEEFQQAGIEFVDVTPYYKDFAIYPLLICYFQSSRALRMFGLSPSARLRWKSLTTQFGTAVAWLIITTLLMVFILTRYGRSVPYIE